MSPTHKYNDPGVYGVACRCNDFGCTSTHSEWVVIEEQTPVYVPNSFTPGGVTSKPDGLNDAFRAEPGLRADHRLQPANFDHKANWLESSTLRVRRQCAQRRYESGLVKLDVYTWKIRFSSISMKGTHRELWTCDHRSVILMALS